MKDCGTNIMVITSFDGEHRFLSNFWVCDNWIEYNGHKWATTEQAYQAAKYKDEDRDCFSLLDEDKISPGKAKRLGQMIEIRSDWNEIKIVVMTKINEEKFAKNPDLMEKLRATKGHELIEGNTWNDTFWGQCPLGNGHNELGKILMGIRDGII